MDILTISNVVKQYSGHLALNSVSLKMPEATIYGLLGPNGAGKSTLIRIINQITAPDSGEVLLYNNKLKPEDVFKIGYLPEERGLYKKMKVGEQAMYLARLKGMSKQDATKELKFWFDKLDIGDWWNKKIEELSKGMAQKIQFVTTVIHRPKLLIFDEPFSGFDPVNTSILKQEIVNLKNNGTSVIFSTHNMDSVEELCDNISLLDHSKVVLQGSVDSIRNSYKSNKIKLSCSSEITENEDFSVLKKESKNNSIFEYFIAKQPEVSNNKIIENLVKQTNILSFEQILPSMNDIFIETVTTQQ